MTTTKTQLWSLYCLYAFAVLFLIGWVLVARFVPPPSPADSAEVIAEQYRDHTTSIRVGLVIALFASALLLPWGGVVCAQIRRIEGRHAVMAWAWAAAQGCVVIEFIYPCIFWLQAAFRTEDAQHVQTFNDLGWLPFLGVVCTGEFQMIALAIVTLRDKRPTPLFPRWFAYFQIWCALGVGFTAGVFLFKTGPLAYDGVLGFWIPVSTYFAWVVVTTVVTARAVRVPDVEYDEPSDLDVPTRLAEVERELADLRASAPATGRSESGVGG